ncbi:hypothetical protein I4U23_007536 [Adineta vaga]|nr:hypothetical protein I4U23_007536 [Adineta vaga]
MIDISMIKLEPTEQDNNCIIANTAIISTSISPSHSSKRLRKAFYSSKTIKTTIKAPTPIVLPNQLHEITHSSMEELSTLTDDELSNLSQFHHRNGQKQNISQESSSKRPRLTHNKRLVANARERERVHNLTAAFEALRKVLPMYGDQEKLSRLSILRIACSYVLVLGALNQIDFSQEQNAYTLNETFHMLSYTILNELKRKKT